MYTCVVGGGSGARCFRFAGLLITDDAPLGYGESGTGWPPSFGNKKAQEKNIH